MKVFLLSLSLFAATFGENIDYHVTVTTASGDDDGTNGHFELYATGHGGDKVQLGVLDNTSGDVALPGSVDEHDFKGIADVGVIVCVEIVAKSDDAWRIVDLTVGSKSSPKYTYLNSNNVLLSNGIFEGQSSLEMCKPKVQYTITTKTAPKYAYSHDAPGTNDRVHATVIGSKSNTTRLRLEASGIFENPFSAGQVDTFVVEDYFDVGDIQCVRFDIDGKDSWVIDRAEVRGPSDKLNVYTTERVMLSQDSSEAPSYAELCRAGGASYDVTIKTSDIKYSESDYIFVRMEIQGAKKRTATTSLLDNTPNRGEVSFYNYENLPNVGKVKCVKLTAYAKGNDMWLFDYIEVVALYNGNVVHISNSDSVAMSSDSSEGVQELTLCK